MLINVFPEFNWQIWRFRVVPNGFIEKFKKGIFIIFLLYFITIYFCS